MSKTLNKKPTIEDVFNLVSSLQNNVSLLQENMNQKFDAVSREIKRLDKRIDETNARIDYYHKPRSIEKIKDLFPLKEVLALEITEPKTLTWANKIMTEIAKLYPSKTYKKIWVYVSKNLHKDIFALLNQVDQNNLLKDAKWFEIKEVN